ncbi:MAG: condensation domain-containing protein, partial [Acidobacteriota bacterium]
MNNIEDIYELSPVQQGILFHCLYAPESAVYFEQSDCIFEGNLNIPAFEQAWQQVFQRHAVLRTSFYWEDLEKPVQAVQRSVKLPLNLEDWRGFSSSKQQELLENLFKKDWHNDLNLSIAPLIRLVLIRLSDNVFKFICRYSHLIMDGWSLSILISDFFLLYESLCNGQRVDLQPSRPFGDYIGWLQSQDLSKAEIFWRKMLHGFSTPNRLWIEKNVVDNKSPNYKERGLKLPARVTAELQSLSRNRNLTLNTLLQGVWALLLSRYSGDTDIIFGVTVSGRPAVLKGIESMVGLFINTLPIRMRISTEISCESFLKNLQDQQIELGEYEYSPLVEVQKWSELPPGQPLFEYILIFENYPSDKSFQP